MQNLRMSAVCLSLFGAVLCAAHGTLSHAIAWLVAALWAFEAWVIANRNARLEKRILDERERYEKELRDRSPYVPFSIDDLEA